MVIGMQVIARTRLLQLAGHWPEADQAMRAWYTIAAAATWRSSGQVRTSDPSASILANRRVVFDILGNRFRLIVKVDYAEHKLFIRFFGTHKQYDTINAAEI